MRPKNDIILGLIDGTILMKIIGMIELNKVESQMTKLNKNKVIELN